MTTDWTVGEEVAWIGPHERRASAIRKIEKIYKTGHLVVGGVRYRPTGHGSAHETGNAWRTSSVHKLTDDLRAQVALSRKAQAAERASLWLRETKPENIPDDLIDALLRAMKVSS